MEEVKREYIRDKYSLEEIVEMIDSSDEKIKAISSDCYDNEFTVFFTDNTYTGFNYEMYFEALCKFKGIEYYFS